MTWPGALSTKSTGELVDASDWNDLVSAINFLGEEHDHTGDDGDGGTLTPITKIAEQEVTGASAADITFSSIPGTYRSLWVKGQIRPINNGVALYAQVNGETSDVYDSVAGGTGYSNKARLSLSSTEIPNTADKAAALKVMFPNYAETNFDKNAIWEVIVSQADDSSPLDRSGGGVIQTTAAITELKFFLSNGNIDVGSYLTLYGIPG